MTTSAEEHAPTAWQSVPTPVRLAIWIWSIAVIVGVAAGAFVLVFGLFPTALMRGHW